MPNKRALQVEVEEPVDTKADVGASLRATLENINTKEGVLGYILRGPSSASVDLKDSSRIIDYAVLSSAAFESSESLSHLFELDTIRNVVLEGKDVKVLCLTIGDHRISIFMDKKADHNSLYRKLT
ncbi:MAG: hypothetical protein PVF15_04655 [Candidatus Bathyarchaeota archaeon]|jgi:predicted regulator of Ras-like GTPase activity (Roadblock/LC7/MglB family)